MGGVAAPDKTNIDPQVRNAATTGRAVLGPDGLMFTEDDAWRPQNAQAALYGPQISDAPPPPVNTPPTVTIAPVPAQTLPAGVTTMPVTVTATGTDAQGAVTYQWANGGPATASWTAQQGVGSVVRTVTVTDTGGLTASASVSTVVNAAPVVPPTSTKEWNRIRVYDASGRLIGYRYVETTKTDVKP